MGLQLLSSLGDLKKHPTILDNLIRLQMLWLLLEVSLGLYWACLFLWKTMDGMHTIWRWPNNASTVNKLRKMVFSLFFPHLSMTASRDLISNLTGNRRKKGQT